MIKKSLLAQGGSSPNSSSVNSPDLVQVRLQHTSDIRVELGSQERPRENNLVAMFTELGKQVLDMERSSVGREASLELVMGSTDTEEEVEYKGQGGFHMFPHMLQLGSGSLVVWDMMVLVLGMQQS